MKTRRFLILIGAGIGVFLLSWLALTICDSFTKNTVPNVIVVTNTETPTKASLSDNWQDSALNNYADNVIAYTFDTKGRLQNIASPNDDDPAPSEPAPNCVIVLGPVKDGKSSVIVASACGKPESLKALENAGPVVLVLYSGTNGTGSQLQLVASDSGGCNSGSYGIADLATWGWDNIASSMRAYCSYGFIYDAAGYGPPAYWCTLGMCNGLGSLNNIGSSARASNSGLLNVGVNGVLP